jgi:SAM-dependent methyltransferase
VFGGAADDYDRFVGRYSPRLAEALCAKAGVAAGQRALDVGCGTGALVERLAALLGPENVAAVEPSGSFAAAAQARVPGARIVVGSAEELPFPADEFDATLSQLVVNFLDDAERGLAEMARVTRPGGVVAGCVWDYGGGMTMLRAFWDAAGPGAADEAATMRYATPAELGALWETAVSDVEVSPVVVEASYADFDDLWAPFPTGVGPAGAYTASLDDDARAALREAYARRLGSPAGPFTLSARAWCAVGKA